MTPGEKIKLLRKDRKLTQEQLADRVEVSKNTIWNYENNKGTIDHKTLVKIANILEVRVGDILGFDQTMLDFESDFDISDFDLEIIEAFNDLAENIKTSHPNVEINNSMLMQNILIDYLARYKAETLVYKHRSFNEFATVDGELFTGKKLFDDLFLRYKHELEEKLKKGSLNDIINNLKEFKDGPPSEYTLRRMDRFIEAYGEDSLPIGLLQLYRDYRSVTDPKEGE